MNARPSSPRARTRALDPRRPRGDSHIILTVTEGLSGLGVVSGFCAAAGVLDDPVDSAVLAGTALLLIGVGLWSRAELTRRPRPTTSAVLSGMVAAWLTLVLVGTLVYLITGTISSPGDAVVEASAGFSTTALTTLDPAELSLPMTLWRASTQWVGGLLGVLVGVVALPMALQQGRLTPTEWVANEDFARSRLARRRQVLAVYLGLTVLLGAAYAATGMGAEHSVVHAFTTISTGGFSSMPDSFVGFGSGSAAVATAGMIVAGSGYAVVWWALRGRVKPLKQSPELRLYAAILSLGTLLVWWNADGLSWSDALFTTASSASTTGFAVLDWTSLNSAVTALLLVIIAAGSMIGSAGGGLQISRVRILVDFARRELRRQLDPDAVVVLKSGSRAVDDRAIERMTGHQICYVASCAAAAGLLALAGVDLVEAVYTGVSVLSTHGPGLGAGAFGELKDFNQPTRLILVPFMLAGRLSLVPLMIAIVWLSHLKKALLRSLRHWSHAWPSQSLSTVRSHRRQK